MNNRSKSRFAVICSKATSQYCLMFSDITFGGKNLQLQTKSVKPLSMLALHYICIVPKYTNVIWKNPKQQKQYFVMVFRSSNCIKWKRKWNRKSKIFSTQGNTVQAGNPESWEEGRGVALWKHGSKKIQCLTVDDGFLQQIPKIKCGSSLQYTLWQSVVLTASTVLRKWLLLILNHQIPFSSISGEWRSKAMWNTFTFP